MEPISRSQAICLGLGCQHRQAAAWRTASEGQEHCQPYCTKTRSHAGSPRPNFSSLQVHSSIRSAASAISILKPIPDALAAVFTSAISGRHRSSTLGCPDRGRAIPLDRIRSHYGPIRLFDHSAQPTKRRYRSMCTETACPSRLPIHSERRPYKASAMRTNNFATARGRRGISEPRAYTGAELANRVI